MSAGVTEGTVTVRTRRGQFECSTSVAWIACDAPACRRHRILANCGDAGVIAKEAEEEGWTCVDAGDFCDVHAKTTG